MVTIDWEKIWRKFAEWLNNEGMQIWSTQQLKIQELVEQELADWFVRQGLNGCCG